CRSGRVVNDRAGAQLPRRQMITHASPLYAGLIVAMRRSLVLLERLGAPSPEGARLPRYRDPPPRTEASMRADFRYDNCWLRRAAIECPPRRWSRPTAAARGQKMSKFIAIWRERASRYRIGRMIVPVAAAAPSILIVPAQPLHRELE